MAATERPDDEALVAFLDGELPPQESARLLDRIASETALRDRLSRLYEGGRHIAPTLDRLLEEAPAARLDALLDAALATDTAEEAVVLPIRRRPVWRSAWMRLAAAIVVAVVAGLAGGAIGYGVRGGGDNPPETWKQAVAEYWSLTTADTLALAPSPEAAIAQLAAAGRQLSLPLTPETVNLAGPSFRGAQIFDFRGRPLVQIAYLDPDYGPVAYCVITDPKRQETEPTVTTLDGFEVVHWSSGGFGHMVIGRAPPERLRQFADNLIAQAG